MKLESRYSEEVGDLLTPMAVEGLQRAADLLGQALPIVKEAMGLLAPIATGHEAAMLRAVEAGEPCGDDVYDAMRDLTPFGRAIDLAFDVLNEVKVIE